MRTPRRRPLSGATNIQTLAPPNHKLVDIQETLDAQNAESGIDHVNLVSITSNEPDDGDIAGDIRLQLRAERSGKGKGRIYTITYEAVGHTTVDVKRSNGN